MGSRFSSLANVRSFAGVEAVFCSIRNPIFAADTGCGGSRTPMGFGPADVKHIRQFAAATPRNGLYQQTRHGGSISRRPSRNGFALYFASIQEPPGWTGKMGADYLTVLVQEFSVGSLE